MTAKQRWVFKWMKTGGSLQMYRDLDTNKDTFTLEFWNPKTGKSERHQIQWRTVLGLIAADVIGVIGVYYYPREAPSEL